jgi:hypothetical protein
MLVFLFAALQQAPAPLSPGENLWGFRCKGCHSELAQPGIPARDILKDYSPDRIVRALETGAMKPMGANLSPDEKRQIATYVTGKTMAAEKGLPEVRP